MGRDVSCYACGWMDATEAKREEHARMCAMDFDDSKAMTLSYYPGTESESGSAPTEELVASKLSRAQIDSKPDSPWQIAPLRYGKYNMANK